MTHHTLVVGAQVPEADIITHDHQYVRFRLSEALEMTSPPGQKNHRQRCFRSRFFAYWIQPRSWNLILS